MTHALQQQESLDGLELPCTGRVDLRETYLGMVSLEERQHLFVAMGVNYAFIGLGTMGYGMASNIRKTIPSNSTLYVFDVYQPSCERFVHEFGSLGPIVVAGSAKDAVTESKVIVSMVPTAQNVREAYLDQKVGCVAAPEDPGRLFLECSTIDSASTREIGEVVRKSHGHYVDSPVSGGPPKAADGTLSFMIGAQPPSSEDESKGTPASYIKPTLSMMGDPGKLFFCNQLGAGAAAKISNNYLCNVFELAIAEAMAIGVRHGIDAKLLHDVIQNSSGQSFMGDRNNPVPGVLPGAPASNGFRPGFRIPLCIKDLALGVEAAKQVGIAPTMAEAALGVWRSAQEDPRCRDRDIAAVWLLLNDINET